MSETNPNFEQDTQLQAIVEPLGRALAVPAPTGLADRVYQATCDLLPAAELQLDAELGRLDQQLRQALGVQALTVAAPADLSRRVQQAVARQDEPVVASGVLARIGIGRMTGRLAAAAAVAILAGAGLWLALGPEPVAPAGGGGSDVDRLLLALDRPATLADPMRGQIVDLMIEVEEVASAVDLDLYGDLAPVGASLEEEWAYLEQQLESF